MAWHAERGEKVGVLIPSRGEVSIEWAVSLSSIATHARTPIEIYVSKHYRVDFSRNDLVEAAIRDGCTHLFFLDSDTFPCGPHPHTGLLEPMPDVIPRLLSHHYPIVSGMYWTKKDGPNLFRLMAGEINRFEPIKQESQQLISTLTFVDGVGIGCCMIDSRVFSRVPYPWFEYKRTDVLGQHIELSEDLAFCASARRAGFGILVDGGVVCKHETLAYLTWGGQAELHAMAPVKARPLISGPIVIRKTPEGSNGPDSNSADSHHG